MSVYRPLYGTLKCPKILFMKHNLLQYNAIVNYYGNSLDSDHWQPAFIMEAPNDASDDWWDLKNSAWLNFVSSFYDKCKLLYIKTQLTNFNFRRIKIVYPKEMDPNVKKEIETYYISKYETGTLTTKTNPFVDPDKIFITEEELNSARINYVYKHDATLDDHQLGLMSWGMADEYPQFKARTIYRNSKINWNYNPKCYHYKNINDSIIFKAANRKNFIDYVNQWKARKAPSMLFLRFANQFDTIAANNDITHCYFYVMTYNVTFEIGFKFAGLDLQAVF